MGFIEEPSYGFAIILSQRVLGVSECMYSNINTRQYHADDMSPPALA